MAWKSELRRLNDYSFCPSSWVSDCDFADVSHRCGLARWNRRFWRISLSLACHCLTGGCLRGHSIGTASIQLRKLRRRDQDLAKRGFAKSEQRRSAVLVGTLLLRAARLRQRNYGFGKICRARRQKFSLPSMARHYLRRENGLPPPFFLPPPSKKRN